MLRQRIEVMLLLKRSIVIGRLAIMDQSIGQIFALSCRTAVDP